MLQQGRQVDFISRHHDNTANIPGESRIVPGVPLDASTLVHYARAGADSRIADEPVFTHVIGQPGEHERLTFRELDRRARAIAANLQERNAAGQPVLIVLEPGLDYAAAVYGCMYAGAIAVPIYPPQMLRLQHTMPRLRAVIENAAAVCMLSDRATIGDEINPMWQLSAEQAIAVDEIDWSDARRWQEVQLSPDSVAILQYTSGSTGNPRGVVLTHRTIINNMESLRHHFHFPGVRLVQWIPPYHDMGLVCGILIPVFVGSESVLISPVDFVRDPLLWLRCIDHYRGTSNGAPNFGYELCVRKIRDADCDGLDLSTWKVAVSGAEPIRASTLERFVEKFEPYGFEPASFCPSFGMAESVLFVTGSRRGETYRSIDVDAERFRAGELVLSKTGNRNVQTLVSSGTPGRATEVVIVDRQSMTRIPDGMIGEIWLHGSSVAQGYWNNPSATAECFGAKLAGDDSREFLRTGDLGAMIDGQLVVTGRCKELIIVGGRNLFPHDIEHTVQSTSDAFRPDCGIAFGLDTDHSEELVVVQEVWRPKKFDLQLVLRDAAAAIQESFGVTPHAIVLVRSGTMPKTSSGKLQRGDLKGMFASGALDEIARWQPGSFGQSDSVPHEEPSTKTERLLAKWWTDLLGVESVSRGDDFFALGGGSLLVLELLTLVREELSVELPISAVFEHSGLKTLASHIDAVSPSSSVNEIARSDAEDHGVHPLSHAQQRFWLLDEMGQTDAFLHVPLSIGLQGDLELEKLSCAFARLIQWHPALRTAIVSGSGGASQTILNEVSFSIEECAAAGDAAFQDWRAEWICRPFDMSRPPLMRVGVWRGGPNFRIEIVFHHLCCDAISVEQLLVDLERALEGEVDEPGEPLRYVDYCHWDAASNATDQRQESLAYWRERLAGVPDRLSFPSSIDQGSPDSAVEMQLNAETGRQIEKLAERMGVTPSICYLTAFQSVLSRYCASSDVPIAMPHSTRPSSKLKGTVGCYVNQLVYRACVNADESVDDAIKSTRELLLGDLEHGDVPFQLVTEEIPHERNGDHLPLAQAMFLYQPELNAVESLGGRKVLEMKPDYSAVTAYDLSLVVHPGREPRVCIVPGEALQAGFAERFAHSLLAVIRYMGEASGDELVRDLPVLAEEEQLLLRRLGSGKRRDLSEQTVLCRVSQYAQKTPDHVAVEDVGGGYTYQQLHALSGRLASELTDQGVEPGALVGLNLPRSKDLLVAILAIWKTGAAYVPLDPNLPGERLEQIKSDAGVSYVVDEETLGLMSRQSGSASIQVDSESLAYVIYTSGSTGKPKGVAIEHSSVSNLLESFSAEPGFGECDSIFALTTIAFDISVLELMLPIWCGGRVYVTQHSVAKEPEAVANELDRQAVTHLQSTPSTLRMLLASGWNPQRDLTVLCGGEPMMPDVARDLTQAGCTLWNVYGPTETTVWSSLGRIESEQLISIGQPIGNTTFEILDGQYQRVPLGVSGELYIGGDGLARGYWNRPELTNDRFVECDSQRLYRTGDVVLRRMDGEIEFLARTDRQVKIRGFRVELDEIEAVLQSHDAVSRAAVITHRKGANLQLVAFLESVATELNVADVLGFAAGKLPEYMIPTLLCIPRIPQTAAGKTDYRNLPVGNLCSGDVKNDPPSSAIEKDLAESWCEVLQIERVGRNENFFDLGGNSLMAAQLFARIRERFNVKLPLKEVYKSPTIATLAELIVKQQSHDRPNELSDLLAKIDALSEEEAIQALVNDNGS